MEKVCVDQTETEIHGGTPHYRNENYCSIGTKFHLHFVVFLCNHCAGTYMFDQSKNWKFEMTGKRAFPFNTES